MHGSVGLVSGVVLREANKWREGGGGYARHGFFYTVEGGIDGRPDGGGGWRGQGGWRRVEGMGG